MGVFRPRNPLFPILGILAPVGVGRVRNCVIHKSSMVHLRWRWRMMIEIGFGGAAKEKPN